MRELSNPLKTWNEQNDFSDEITREIEDAVDIENLKSDMFDAFDFEAT